MSSQILSQDEIDALLKGGGNDHSLTSIERDALGEIGNIAFGSASTALSTLLNKRIELNTPTVDVITIEQLRIENPMPCITVEVDYKRGLSGSNFMIIQAIDAAIIADLMMGGDGNNPKSEITDMELSALGEAMNVMMGTASTSMSTLFNKRVDIDPPRVNQVDLGASGVLFPAAAEGEMVRVSFKLLIEELVDSSLMLIIPVDFAREMSENLIVEPVAPPPVQARPQPQNHVPTFQAPPPVEVPPMKPPVTVQPVQFAPITQATSTRENGNIGLLMDVPLQLSVELGSTRMKIKEILELGMGSIIELDRLAGEPVDILVNGKLIAKGEVVVIDENFGVKVTDILSPVDRVNSLQ